MKAKTIKLLIEWIMLIMYIVASKPDVGQIDRDALGYKTKELTDQLENEIEQGSDNSAKPA